MSTVIVAAVIVLCLELAARSVIKDKKRGGCSGCSGSCGGCAGHCQHHGK